MKKFQAGDSYKRIIKGRSVTIEIRELRDDRPEVGFIIKNTKNRFARKRALHLVLFNKWLTGLKV